MVQIQTHVANALKNGILKKPKHCENCGEEKPIIGHHRDYTKPLEITWLCRSCHVKEHNSRNIIGKPDRHMIQFDEDLWKIIHKAAIKASQKEGRIVPLAEYVRRVLKKHAKRMDVE